MKYGHEFSIVRGANNFFINVYFLNYKSGFPTRFHIFVKGYCAGFMYYDNGWMIDRDYRDVMIDEEMINEIGYVLINFFM